MRFARAGALIVIASATFLIGRPANAACHSFFFGDDPDKTVSVSVKEGDAVELTVSRDAAVADSAVHVQSIDGTAKSGDFNKVDMHVEFTGESTQETVTVTTKEDVKDEPNETLQLKLSNAEGCPVNTDYEYGPNAKVTIVDDDPALKTPTPRPIDNVTPKPTPKETPTPSPSPSPSPSVTPSVPPTGEPEETVTETFSPPEIETSEGGGFPWLPVLAVVGFLAAGGGALILTRLRRGV